MTLRLHVPQPLTPGQEMDLPSGAVRHVQVRRLQPGQPLRLFDGCGHEWAAQLLQIGRQAARVLIGDPLDVTPELPLQVTLAVGVPANERMDTLVEKATELGVAVIQPLLTERSVLRLAGERAQRKQAHWQAIASAACEQCGRATVPQVMPMQTLPAWSAGLAIPVKGRRWLLSPDSDAPSLPAAAAGPDGHSSSLISLSGPEGGLSPAEVLAARTLGFQAVNLGPRILRADTAPLALMAWISQVS